MLDQIKTINLNGSIFEEEFDVGGDWACVIGCASFCFIGGGSTTYIAMVATAL